MTRHSGQPAPDGDRLPTMMSNAARLTGARLTGDVASLLFFVLLSRYFGPAGVGRYAFGFAISSLLFALVNLGSEDYAIRECSRMERPDRRRLIGILLGVQLRIAALCLLGLGAALGLGILRGEEAQVVLLLTLFQMATVFARTLFVPAYVDEAMWVPALADVTARVGSIALAIVGITLLDLSLSWALVPFPLGGAALLACAAVSARRRNRGLVLSFDWQEARQLLIAIWPFGASMLVYMLYSRADLVMIRVMIGEDRAGIYAAALKFLEVGGLPLYFLALAAYPTLSRLFNENLARFRVALDGCYRSTLVAAALLAWTLYWVAPEILVRALGTEFAPGSPVVRWMALLALIIGFETVGMRVMLAIDLQVQRLKVQTLGTALNIVLNLAVIPIWGVVGAVAASIAAQAVIASLSLTLAGRVADIRRLRKANGQFLALATSAVLVSMLVGRLGTADHWVGGITLLAFVAGAFAISFVPTGAWRGA